MDGAFTALAGEVADMRIIVQRRGNIGDPLPPWLTYLTMPADPQARGNRLQRPEGDSGGPHPRGHAQRIRSEGLLDRAGSQHPGLKEHGGNLSFFNALISKSIRIGTKHEPPNHLDMFAIDLDGNPELVVNLLRYFLPLFSRQRETGPWKVMLQVRQDTGGGDGLLLTMRDEQKLGLTQ